MRSRSSGNSARRNTKSTSRRWNISLFFATPTPRDCYFLICLVICFSSIDGLDFIFFCLFSFVSSSFVSFCFFFFFLLFFFFFFFFFFFSFLCSLSAALWRCTDVHDEDEGGHREQEQADPDRVAPERCNSHRHAHRPRR